MTQQPNPELDKVLEKIQKLLNLANNNPNEHEAAVAMGKAQELAMEHAISIEMLEGHKPTEKNGVTEERFDLNEITNRREGTWARELIWGIASFNLCKALFLDAVGQKDNMGKMAIMGTPTNIQVTYDMMGYLLPTIKDWHKRAWNAYHGDQKAGAYKRDFLIACTRRLRQRMTEMLAENKKHQEQLHPGAGTALIHIGNKVELFMKEKYQGTTTSKARATQARDGAYEGHNAGSKISLNKQIS